MKQQQQKKQQKQQQQQQTSSTAAQGGSSKPSVMPAPCTPTCGMSNVTPHTSQVISHTSLITRNVSHITSHTSHVTRHTSHVTRHKQPSPPHHDVGSMCKCCLMSQGEEGEVSQDDARVRQLLKEGNLGGRRGGDVKMMRVVVERAQSWA